MWSTHCEVIEDYSYTGYFRQAVGSRNKNKFQQSVDCFVCIPLIKLGNQSNTLKK